MAVHADVDEDGVEVGGEFDFLDGSDADGAAADFGFAGGDAVRGIEADACDGADGADVLIDEPAADEDGEDGDDPDDVPSLGGSDFG